MELHVLELRKNGLGLFVIGGRLFDRRFLGRSGLLVRIVGRHHLSRLWSALLLFRRGARCRRILVVCLFLLYLLIVRDVSWIGHSSLYTHFAPIACLLPHGPA